MTSSVIVSGARTPMGRLLGNLKHLPATALGGHAIAAALSRGGVDPERVQYVIMGQVLQAGCGQIPARQAAVAAGIPMTTPALTVNKVCLSGIDAVALADQLIRAGEFDVVVAGGMESMTNAPHLLADQRQGRKFGDVLVRDHTAIDGLMDPWAGISMGESTEASGARLGITREQQDAFAARSHQRAAAAQRDGRFAEEIAAVPAGGRDAGQVIDTDEGVRPGATAESLSTLRPAFTPDGTITAASSSPISDGAAALIVMSRAKAEELGLTWIAEIVSHGNVAGPDSSLQSQPSNAIKHALDKAGLEVDDLDLIEINEAFAQVAIQSARELKVDEEIVNVNGGAIALGHPIGMSGARLVLTLALELRRRGGGLGAAALCGGGGQGDALIIKVPAA
ncbi:acetyl-CoA C-acetyltransferase [Actinoplanes campanulatus]|uniref:Probable acetyl-CoA acetyltransferase n=1 Tax=Actinoplanes campanulatus TaxID=113559 RepID=A0A7W5ABJ6_9ACTN|nr:acetyl-CoA C-acetyltransferase [Actinoplanes campanulatus]MBB3093253.1 acetyl-CoA C-acetyltransferase [Actinoplanes campanulatus]GGN02296.1 acetyl-CoA acetyltransferase [Actinoplanes campanulatus]GID33652.1 acetyl-CoA acetyltransferase [Actinoplanes campanulatus]